MNGRKYLLKLTYKCEPEANLIFKCITLVDKFMINKEL